MQKKLVPWDSSKYLGTEEDIAAYLAACSETDDPAAIVLALGSIARARNMSALARQIDMTREGLYKALSPSGNPSFTTVIKVASALGYPLTFRVKAKVPEAKPTTAKAAPSVSPDAIENGIRALALLDETVAKASELRESLLRFTAAHSRTGRPAGTKRPRRRDDAGPKSPRESA